MTIVWNKDERKLIDNGGYYVLTRNNEVKLCQWQNGRGAFYTERENRPGDWSDSLSVHMVAGWCRPNEVKVDYVNPPKPKPVEEPKPEPVVETPSDLKPEPKPENEENES